MKYVRFQVEKKIKYGILEGEQIRETQNPFIKGQELVPPNSYSLGDVTLLAPCEPSKVICVGLNYADHAKELNLKLPNKPLLFMKPSTTVIGPGAKIIYPQDSQRVDYEGELAVVIKDKIKDIEPNVAEQSIFGFTCANDITARDLQKLDGQWTRAKSFDTFLPLGSYIETEADASDLQVTTKLNGKVMQSSSTKQMVFGVNYLVSYISKIMTLLPGDVIITGTPFGVGQLDHGDEVEVTIEGLGTLINYVEKP
ncbi:2-keto-4-pentenoate hydratase/2-oxohepta-3-ene-1,7-dioic acid hydratase in catechol pathway [Desulfitispora alkaliphila]|uniref:fumarylacetoacetate hydrolase family protein n=1 Tax=Desulfitispora alkaliphila TaxID=622674 RepID=UPI003D1E3C10